MAETAIAAVLSKFVELAAVEAKILLEVGDNMMLLRDRLEWLQAFIRDADRRRHAGTDDQLTRVWVRQTRDVSFQADDALDEFVYKVDLKTQGYRCWKKIWRKYLIGFFIQIYRRHVLFDRIERVNIRLAKIAETQKEYNIGHTPLPPVTSSTTSTSAWSNDAVGFDNDVMTLKQMLFREDHTRQMFISILGESGVGKDTLVNMLHNHVTVEMTTQVFRVVIWYPAPPDSNVEFVLQDLYNRAVDWCKRKGIVDINQSNQDDGIVDIADKLRRLLANKRYLVILGGIFSKAKLNCMRASLPDDNNGSRVLLVLDIESEEVALHANSMNQGGFNGIHMLSRLGEKRSGKLFHSRAFRREEVSDRSKKHMANRYNKIVYDITGGYPLAIVILAGLLRFKERPGQWEAVLQQLRPGPTMMEKALVQGGNGEGNYQKNEGEGSEQIIEVVQSTSHADLVSTKTTTIERVFWASFEDLSDDLKLCFLYFAAFLKDTSGHANRIVLMWIAEGFIKPQKGKTMEELGHNYLKELILRCLVEVDSMNAAGGIGQVMVHPRLHGFLQSEAREAGFMEVHDRFHVFVPPSVRRLSFMSLGGRYISFTNKFPKLRSFICWVQEEEQHHQSTNSQDMNKKHGHDLNFLCGSKLLRVIDVDGLRIKELPNRIGDMIHLRYLGIFNCKDLKQLPSSIKRLLNLQTLDISGTQVEMIDPGFWKIRTLRHVFAENLTLPEIIEQELATLHSLCGVKPAAEGGQWNEHNCPLHKMPNLWRLKLHGITEEKHGEALASALGKMPRLAYLNLKGDVIPSCIFTAPMSLQLLQTVELEGNITEWPQVGWDASKVRPNLINVNVKNCNTGVPQYMREEFDKIHNLNAFA